jgi:hypothetical protein
VWSPGDVDVQAAGEFFHSDAILAALFEVSPKGFLTAVLVSELGNPHSEHAVGHDRAIRTMRVAVTHRGVSLWVLQATNRPAPKRDP